MSGVSNDFLHNQDLKALRREGRRRRRETHHEWYQKGHAESCWLRLGKGEWRKQESVTVTCIPGRQCSALPAERHHPVLRVQVATRGLPQRAPTTLSQLGSASDCCEALDNRLKSSESQVPPLYRLFFHSLWKSESTRELFLFFFAFWIQMTWERWSRRHPHFYKISRKNPNHWTGWSEGPLRLWLISHLWGSKKNLRRINQWAYSGWPSFYTETQDPMKSWGFSWTTQSCPSSGKSRMWSDLLPVEFARWVWLWASSGCPKY